jgi:hypothetical protein
MKSTRARLAAIFILAATATSACGITPQPIKDDAWEAGAANAAHAEPAPEVLTARAGNEQGQTVVATAMQSVVSAQSLAESADKKPSPVIAVANVEPSADIHATPGPEASADEVARWLSTVWKRDKPAAWIRERLAQKTAEKLEEKRVRLTTGDFDADDKPDLAASFFADCADQSCLKGGRWTVGVVWGDSGWSQLATSEDAAPEFFDPVDLTGDEHPELIFTTEQCGAHTCYKHVEVLSGHGDSRFRRIFHLGDDVEGYGSRGLPQEVEIVEATDGDDVGAALPRLEVSGGLVGSAGAGVFQRASHTSWAWQPESGKLGHVGTCWEPSNLRLHRFHDAIVELQRGNPARAEKLLSEVINSDKLDELPSEASPDPAFAEAMRTQLAHTARFVLARLALQRSDVDRFARLRDELQASTPNSPATRAVLRLDEKWRGKEQAAAACQAAAKAFPTESDDDWVLDSFQLGYNAPVTFDADVERGLCAGLDAPSGS